MFKWLVKHAPSLVDMQILNPNATLESSRHKLVFPKLPKALNGPSKKKKHNDARFYKYNIYIL